MLVALPALGLAGCQGEPVEGQSLQDHAPNGAALPVSLLHVDLDLQLGPPADDVVPGIVLGYDDCGFIRSAAQGDSTTLVEGTLTLDWDDSDGLQMNLSVRAEEGRTWVDVPAGPSPRTLTLRDVEVGWTAAVLVLPGFTLPPGELQRPATLAIDLTYTGDEPVVHSTNC